MSCRCLAVRPNNEALTLVEAEVVSSCKEGIWKWDVFFTIGSQVVTSAWG